MKKQDFYYELPEELIAQDPLADRSSSRLLVLDKQSRLFPIMCLRMLWTICKRETAW